MREAFTIVLLTLVTPVFSQIELNESGIYQMQGVEPIDSLGSDQLFDKCREWVALTYKSSNDVIQLADKENGKIICKGNFPTNMFMKQGNIEHTLILELKDKRFRYTYTNFAYYSAGSGRLPFEGAMMGKRKIIAETERDINDSISGLKKHFSNSKNDDW